MNTKINVVTRLQDNQDGGYTMFIYNNNEEMLADHPKAKTWGQVNGKYQEIPVELTEEQKQDILNENDPYEDGYLGTDTIEITPEGKIVPFSLHAGQ